VAEQSELGGVVLRSLLRSQFRLAALVAGAFLTAVAALWIISEAAGDLPWLPGVPLVWLLIGALPYPAALVAAVAYYRAANRTEQRYAELLEDHP
jgi:membrane protein implicated in regulation of membrane protease activity